MRGYLPGIYGGHWRYWKYVGLALGGLLNVVVQNGCASIEQAPTPVKMAPTSDVRKIAAWKDAERLAAQSEGGSPAVGRGESMAPVFGDTTMLVLTEIPFDDLEPGMMVAYRNERGVQVVHQLVRRTSRGEWQARGINNPAPDHERITRANYLGVVYAALAHERQGEPEPAAPSP
jgi:hypothetical protein